MEQGSQLSGTRETESEAVQGALSPEFSLGAKDSRAGCYEDPWCTWGQWRQGVQGQVPGATLPLRRWSGGAMPPHCTAWGLLTEVCVRSAHLPHPAAVQHAARKASGSVPGPGSC